MKIWIFVKFHIKKRKKIIMISTSFRNAPQSKLKQEDDEK